MSGWPLAVSRWPLTVSRWPLTVSRWPLTVSGSWLAILAVIFTARVAQADPEATVGTSTPRSDSVSIVLERARTARDAARDRFEDALSSVHEDRTETEDRTLQVRAGLDAGRLDQLRSHVEPLLGARFEERTLAGQLLMALHETERLQELAPRMFEGASDLADADRRDLRYRWLFYTDDLATVEAMSREWVEREAHPVDLLASSRLMADIFELDSAHRHLLRAREAADSDRLRGRAENGLSVVAYKQKDFDRALGHAIDAVTSVPCDPDALHQLALCLIRVGRTDEAITAAELSVAVDPLHEDGHYLLGNGYARKNYTQLFESYPQLFAFGARDANGATPGASLDATPGAPPDENLDAPPDATPGDPASVDTEPDGSSTLDTAPGDTSPGGSLSDAISSDLGFVTGGDLPATTTREADGVDAVREADALLEQGRHDDARTLYFEIHRAHPKWVDVLARIGSLEYLTGNPDESVRWFREALAICPEYGRAHNGLAKALEAKRLAAEVHRDAYERTFARAEEPEIPGIDQFVVNWDALSPRHQKQVALSIEPWARFIPALIAGGSTYYIKPLHELLSETPGQAALRDLRISYDSRLWDDVRGCGGYSTVTGVEDVERTVLGRYNTVLHELTHQVHGILPSDRQRAIQELYRRAKERDAAGEDVFLSRYAGSSVWEYFAEGANALETPTRDEYDTREIVRERLLERDRALVALVDDLMHEASVDSCFPVAYVGRAYHELESAEIEDALASTRLALKHDPKSEPALQALVYALQLADSTEAAVEWADQAVALHPMSGGIATSLAAARWHAGWALPEAIEELRAARSLVRDSDQFQVDLELGRLEYVLGRFDSSLAAYDRVLAYQADNPEALWGRARSLAAAERWAEAWKVYDTAVRRRTGVINLRADYARDLLRAGRLQDARDQIEEALLLDDGEAEVRVLRAWLTLEDGDASIALTEATTALEHAPWSSWARVVRARALLALNDPAGALATLRPLRRRLDRFAPPEYVFREKWGRWEAVYTMPAVLRAEIAEQLAALSGELGR